MHVNVASALIKHAKNITSLCLFFLHMFIFNRAETTAEHDWLNPLSPLSVSQTHAERTSETCRRALDQINL